MTGELSGKVAVVTGGAAGIGRATVSRFVEEGARVVIADVDEVQGEELSEQLGAAAIFKRTDVADREAVRELVSTAVETFGGLNVMVNNAGISGPLFPTFLDDDLAAFERVYAVNVLGVMAGTQAAARVMAQGGGGSIINVTSIGGILAGRSTLTYRGSKAAVIQFTKSVAIDLGEHRIRVNALAPGGIPTSLLGSAALGSAEDRAEFIETIRKIQAAGRPLDYEGTAEDVADAVVYLASDKSKYVTGAVLRVDGGTAAGNTYNPLTAVSGQ